MQLKYLLILLSLVSLNVNAGNSILGKWSDKSDPNAHTFEFKKGNDFIYIKKWIYQGKTKSSKSIGVWEKGSWVITTSKGSKDSCNITIYADTKECCFNYKFIGKNLILTSKYTDGYGGSMCENRVLIKPK